VTKKCTVAIIAACGFATLAGVVVWLLNREPYRGGNLYARLTCKSYLLMAEMAAQDHYPLFDIARLKPSDRRKLADLQSAWTGGAVFLVKSNFTFRSEERRSMISLELRFGTVELRLTPLAIQTEARV
jgi:hypothetical protein